jgi:hypothetical protein
MKAHELVGKKIALLLIGTKENGDDDWVVFAGTVYEVNGALYVDFGGRWPLFEIRDEWAARVRPTDDKSRDILLDAELFIPLTVGNLPDDAPPSEFQETGLKWPG